MKFESSQLLNKVFKMVAVVVGLACLGFGSSVSIAESPAKVAGATTVDLQQARELYDAGSVFIDVRDTQAWNYGHIDGAVHLDFNADEFVILYVSDALDRETPIVFYTDSALGTTGAMAAFFASSWGYKNVYFFRDGYYSWMASDHPVEFNIAVLNDDISTQ